MKNIKGAFTLVELIVVITILAILVTAAFVGLGGYSDKAKTSVKIGNLKKVESSFKSLRLEGVKYSTMLESFTGVLLPSGSQIGGTGIIIGKDYNAGNINYRVLELKEDSFEDNGNKIKYAYTLKKGGNYELAITIIKDNIKKSYSVGTYFPRNNILIEGVFNDNYFIINDSKNINKLFKDDYVVDSLGNIAKILKISDDYMTIYLSNTSLSGNTISLVTSPEVAGLIKSPVTGNPVTNSSEDIPYNLN